MNNSNERALAAWLFIMSWVLYLIADKVGVNSGEIYAGVALAFVLFVFIPWCAKSGDKQ